MKASSSTLSKVIKTMKKNVDVERIRTSASNSKTSLSSALSDLSTPSTPKRIRSIGKGTKKVINNIKNKI